MDLSELNQRLCLYGLVELAAREQHAGKPEPAGISDVLQKPEHFSQNRDRLICVTKTLPFPGSLLTDRFYQMANVICKRSRCSWLCQQVLLFEDRQLGCRLGFSLIRENPDILSGRITG